MGITTEQVSAQAEQAVTALLQENRPHFNPVKLLVIGGSSSEIAGGTIGHNSTYEYGEAVVEAVMKVCREAGVAPAFQCCEHLNRALIMERETAERYGYEIVWVIPRIKAGGSLATAAWKRFKDPVAVLAVQADAGLDIGQTLIGMHLRRVAVPVRLSISRVGEARITAARTRPLLVGGERARYVPESEETL
ncbi:TIGR01440 family protein [Aristaeella lactis]|uniref:TIGR01440 family protein n=1 Tax=Aristaeella lactis TaxID=3046383 RepID=A0AC61PQ31_9FIRM|nr:TIGR01440 family protein [Aristaeella lactis]QUA54262.1 TIGR01440 family protein [Aristaeella lactis]SMC88294.1 TIGR01440 family protein [Aristaeella lactis]